MKNFTALTITVLLICGCAYTPHEVNLMPTINVSSSTEGNNTVVAIKVLDERTSTIIGERRGQTGPQGSISSKTDIVPLIRKNISDGLRKKGFNPTNSTANETPLITVELRLLEYSTARGFWTGGVFLKSAVRVYGAKGSADFSKMYRAVEEKRVGVVPNLGTNERWINDILSDVLNQVLEDEELLNFLAS